jgi:hypothetical protein
MDHWEHNRTQTYSKEQLNDAGLADEVFPRGGRLEGYHVEGLTGKTFAG